MNIDVPLIGSVSTGFGDKVETIDKNKYSDDRELKEACKDFASILFAQMFEAMRGNPDEQKDEDGISGSLFGGENMYMFLGFLDQEIGKKFSEQGGMELVNTLYHQLKGDMTYKKKENNV
jgi:Rod binding domain-containing protein